MQESIANGITPDFIIDHFILFCIYGTAITPVGKICDITVMAIQLTTVNSSTKIRKKPPMNYNYEVTVITLYSVGIAFKLLQVVQFTLTKH